MLSNEDLAVVVLSNEDLVGDNGAADDEKEDLSVVVLSNEDLVGDNGAEVSNDTDKAFVSRDPLFCRAEWSKKYI